MIDVMSIDMIAAKILNYICHDTFAVYIDSNRDGTLILRLYMHLDMHLQVPYTSNVAKLIFDVESGCQCLS